MEPLQQLERAKAERLWDGLTLAMDPESRNTGATYLMGYALELSPKCAYDRALGLQRTDDTTLERNKLNQRCLTLGVARAGRTFHDLSLLF